jgi:prepilin signal peptidase PulO-like enzyme (type II secretory pathway)
MNGSEETWIFYYIVFWLAVLGGVAGSTLDCAAWRMAHGESMWRGRSHCGACGHVLGARDLVPVFSYLCHGSRCRYCGTPIGAECLVTELAGIALFAGLGLKFGLGLELVMWLVLGCILLLLSVIDWNQRRIPDRLLLAAVVNRVVFLFLLRQPLGSTLLAMLVGGLSVSLPLLVVVLIMDKLMGRETMGGGDIKLLFVLGLYLDWMQMVLLLLTGCVLALAAAMGMRGRTKESVGIPFGPFLGLAWFLVLVLGDSLLDWYRGLLAV